MPFRTMMQSPDKNRPWGSVSILALSLVTLFLLDTVDYDLTLFLYQNRKVDLVQFMSRSLFEGEKFGAGDPVIIFLLLSVIGYYLTIRFPQKLGNFGAFRPHFGYIVTTGLFSAIMMVHSIKWTLGRTRPFLVLQEGLPYNAWYETGFHFVTQGVYRGSFPSGHTAQACLLIAICYILAGDRAHTRLTRWAGVLLSLIVLAYAVAMGAYRCMFLSHWTTDVAGAIGFTILSAHLIYFHLLDVPSQSAYFKKAGTFPPMPAGFELHVSFNLFGAMLGIMGSAIGLRGLIRGDGPLFILILLAGLTAAGFMIRRLILGRKQLTTALNTTP